MSKRELQKQFFNNTDLTPKQTVKMVQDGLVGTDFGEFFQEARIDQSIVKSKGRYVKFSTGSNAGFGFRAGVDTKFGYNHSAIFNKATLAEAIKSSRQVLAGYQGTQDINCLLYTSPSPRDRG